MKFYKYAATALVIAMRLAIVEGSNAAKINEQGTEECGRSTVASRSVVSLSSDAAIDDDIQQMRNLSVLQRYATRLRHENERLEVENEQFKATSDMGDANLARSLPASPSASPSRTGAGVSSGEDLKLNQGNSILKSIRVAFYSVPLWAASTVAIFAGVSGFVAGRYSTSGNCDVVDGSVTGESIAK